MKLLSKFKYLLKYGIKRRIGSKAFKIANVIIFIALLALMNLPNIIAFFDDGKASQVEISIYDETNKGLETIDILNQYGQQFAGLLPGSTITFKVIDSFDKTAIDYQGAKAVLHLKAEADVLVVDMYKNDLEAIHESLILQVMSQFRINVWAVDKNASELELIEDFLAPLRYEVFQEGADNTTRDMILSTLAMLIAIPIFIMLIMSVQFVGVDIIEEKSTKAIEYVMSTVPPQTHFMTKILASFTFLIVQSLLIFLYGLIAGFISTKILGASSSLSVSEIIGQFTQTDSQIISTVFRALPGALLVTLLFTVVGGLFFMIFMATLASMSTSMEDFQSFQSPFMFVMMIGFYAAIFSIYMGDSIILKIIGYLPLFSPIVAPTLYMSGTMSLLDVVLSFILLLISTVGAYYVLSPIYKASILSYDQSSFFKRIKKMFKRSKEV